MNIEINVNTKYKIGELVWALNWNTAGYPLIVKTDITNIVVIISSSQNVSMYVLFGFSERFRESELFTSFDDAADALLKEIERHIAAQKAQDTGVIL